MFPSVDFERLGLDPNDPNAARVLSTIIEPNDVIGAIRRFVEDCKVMNPIEVCIWCYYYYMLRCSNQFDVLK